MELEQTLHPIGHWLFMYREASLRLPVADELYRHSISLASILSPSIYTFLHSSLVLHFRRMEMLYNSLAGFIGRLNISHDA